MKPTIKTISSSLVALVLLLLAAGFYLAGYDEPSIDPAWAANTDEGITDGAVTVRWSGISTLVISDGESTIVTDGWFSRPGIFSWIFGELYPDLEAISFGLKQNQLTQADVVFAFHSHHDHAQDAPEVARRTGALLMGSPSTAMIGRGWGLPESQIQVVEDGKAYQVGAFTLTPVLTYHAPTMTEGGTVNAHYETIDQPLVPPVSIRDYKVGASYTLHIQHPKGAIMITSSAGYRQGALKDLQADVYLLGLGGFEGFPEEYRQQYWRETIEQAGPHTVIPIHWDALTGPIEGEFRGQMRLINLLIAGGSSGEPLSDFVNRKAVAENLRVMTLPRYQPVLLFP